MDSIPCFIQLFYWLTGQTLNDHKITILWFFLGASLWFHSMFYATLLQIDRPDIKWSEHNNIVVLPGGQSWNPFHVLYNSSTDWQANQTSGYWYMFILIDLCSQVISGHSLQNQVQCLYQCLCKEMKCGLFLIHILLEV